MVHVAYRDAEAYAAWAGKALPTEAEWEFAAKGGLDDAEFAWGDELTPGGRHMANTWQGAFPAENTKEDGWARTSPVGAFPPNGYGLYDMIGNVWEWTTDFWSTKHQGDAPKACCVPQNPRGGGIEASYDPRQPEIRIPRKVLKGGSHLCAPNYCRRYRPAARHAEPIDTSTSHVGFRCVVRDRTSSNHQQFEGGHHAEDALDQYRIAVGYPVLHRELRWRRGRSNQAACAACQDHWRCHADGAGALSRSSSTRPAQGWMATGSL